jgi:hypothetical protein
VSAWTPAGPRPAWRVQTRVRADRSTVYALVAEVELWPAVFPDVTYARVLRRAGARRLIAVRSGRPGLLPARRAVQALDPERGLITFKHLGPLNGGAVTRWSIAPADDGVGVNVEVAHRSARRWPPIVPALMGRLLGLPAGPDAARKMLERLKYVAEGGSLAGT